ncbi:hypothetical protein EIK77_000481 [Talaromyces pinophilus]|nr:hypothetical protein EIK77_000481 [Talaromyces pinophilus]
MGCSFHMVIRASQSGSSISRWLFQPGRDPQEALMTLAASFSNANIPHGMIRALSTADRMRGSRKSSSNFFSLRRPKRGQLFRVSADRGVRIVAHSALEIPPRSQIKDDSSYGFYDGEYEETEIPGLCSECGDDLDGWSDFPEWVTLQLIDGHSFGGVEGLGTDTLDYNIMTPRMGPWKFRRFSASQTPSDSDDDSLSDSFDDESTASESSDTERHSLSNTNTPLRPDPFDPDILKQLSRPFTLTQGNDETSILGKRKRE